MQRSWVIFLIKWLGANAVGFTIGSLLGASSGGWIPAQFSGPLTTAGLILGDLVFGACIGLAQWLVLQSTSWRGLSASWVILTALGFTVGARVGPVIAPRVSTDPNSLAISFGIVMGLAQGVATWVLARTRIRSAWTWPVMMALAWSLGELIAFRHHFSQWAVPWVGLAVASVMALFIADSRAETTNEPGEFAGGSTSRPNMDVG